MTVGVRHGFGMVLGWFWKPAAASGLGISRLSHHEYDSLGMLGIVSTIGEGQQRTTED